MQAARTSISTSQLSVIPPRTAKASTWMMLDLDQALDSPDYQVLLEERDGGSS